MFASAAFFAPELTKLIDKPNFIELLIELSKSKFEFTRISDNEQKIAEIQNEFIDGNLVVVLGAGASVDYGLPSWNTLLHTLMSKSLMAESITHGKNQQNPKNGSVADQKALLFSEVFNGIFLPDPLIAARYLSNNFERSELIFEHEIRNILYQNIDTSYTSPLMKELVQICAAPGRSPNLDSIITYNFDDILEAEIWKSSITIPIKPIYVLGQRPTQLELPIYHVHGYIPRTGPIGIDNKITLGEDIYHQQYLDIYNWQNLVQISKFKEKTCLFIGSSFTDPNQRRLLDIAQKQRPDIPLKHYVIKKKISVEYVNNKLKSFFDSHPDILNKKETINIPFDELAHAITSASQQFEIADAQSLGVDTIWVDEFEEIPRIIHKIRASR